MFKFASSLAIAATLLLALFGADQGVAAFQTPSVASPTKKANLVAVAGRPLFVSTSSDFQYHNIESHNDKNNNNNNNNNKETVQNESLIGVVWVAKFVSILLLKFVSDLAVYPALFAWRAAKHVKEQVVPQDQQEL